MGKPRMTRWCLFVAALALALLGLVMIFLPSMRAAGCPEPGFCLTRVNPYKVWLGLACALAVIWGVFGALMLPRRSQHPHE
jgi:hypothetical protein